MARAELDRLGHPVTAKAILGLTTRYAEGGSVPPRGIKPMRLGDVHPFEPVPRDPED